MQETLQVLFFWVLLKVGAPPIVPPPDVKFVTQQELSKMYEGQSPVAATPSAIYNFKDRTIYLPTGFKGDTAEEQSTLVHELVHHLQAVLDVSRGNICLIELDAYVIEDEWRKENGLETITTRPGFMFYIGKCTVLWFKARAGVL